MASPAPFTGTPPAPLPGNTVNADAAADARADAVAADVAADGVADVVESPSISSPTALARYEYDHGSPLGTKILMVEWRDTALTRASSGAWHVEWDGSERVVRADDTADTTLGDTGDAADVHRVFFLLPPASSVPARVTLTHRARDGHGGKEVVWHTNPLPALYPAELGAKGKGVLHTLWAKKRLAVLEREISAESRENAEGVGLEMAVQERAWIEEAFGVRGSSADRGTDGAEDAGNGTPGTNRHAENPLSPAVSDLAVSSFSSFALLNGGLPALAAKPPQRALRLDTVPIAPPPHIQNQHQDGDGGMASLNALALALPPSSTDPLTNLNHPPAAPAQAQAHSPPAFESRAPAREEEEEEEDDIDEGLFASPIDPRSPELGRSPFSFR